MNDRFILIQSNRLLNNDNVMMHHHIDQAKMISNDSIYQTDQKYQMDEGFINHNMIDELIIAGSEPLNDLSHLESALNKAPMVSSNISSTNLMPMMNEDYFNQLTFGQIPNMGQNSNYLNNNNGNHNQYTFHTLQPPQTQHSQNNYNQHMSSNSSYLSLGMSNSSALNSNNTHSFGSKIVSRTPSFNSSSIGSSSSSPSSSNSSLNNLQQNGSNLSNINTNSSNNNSNNNLVTSSTNEQLDQDLNNSSSSNLTSDPAEVARLKQLRGIKLTPEELQLLLKDRQRKDNHNMIERRRRFNINDRIKELGLLIPKNGEFDTKQNKGSILKASVDYIMRVKTDIDEAKKIYETNKHLLVLNKKLYNRVKELENLCRINGISTQCQNLQNNSSNNNISNPSSNYGMISNGSNKNDQQFMQHQSLAFTSPNSNLNDNLNLSNNFSNNLLNNSNISDINGSDKDQYFNMSSCNNKILQQLNSNNNNNNIVTSNLMLQNEFIQSSNLIYQEPNPLEIPLETNHSQQLQQKITHNVSSRKPRNSGVTKKRNISDVNKEFSSNRGPETINNLLLEAKKNKTDSNSKKIKNHTLLKNEPISPTDQISKDLTSHVKAKSLSTTDFDSMLKDNHTEMLETSLKDVQSKPSDTNEAISNPNQEQSDSELPKINETITDTPKVHSNETTSTAMDSTPNKNSLIANKITKISPSSSPPKIFITKITTNRINTISSQNKLNINEATPLVKLMTSNKDPMLSPSQQTTNTSFNSSGSSVSSSSSSTPPPQSSSSSDEGNTLHVNIHNGLQVW